MRAEVREGARVSSYKLSFHGGEVIDVDGLSRAIEGDDDGESDGDFCGGDGDDEENESLSVIVREAIGHVGAGEGNEGEVSRRRASARGT